MKNGLVTVPSRFTVEETVANLQGILIAKGTKLFAIIDHSLEAAAAGLAMPPTKLVVFGNPRGGTPLMVAAPSIAIDLPMKLLIWEDVKGSVWISYNAPSYLAARHGLEPELSPALDAVKRLASATGHEST
jgi:uncharacterized protein (DUF302 family)